MKDLEQCEMDWVTAMTDLAITKSAFNDAVRVNKLCKEKAQSLLNQIETASRGWPSDSILSEYSKSLEALIVSERDLRYETDRLKRYTNMANKAEESMRTAQEEAKKN